MDAMATDMMTYAPGKGGASDVSEKLMELDLCVHTADRIFIFHDRPFSKTLSWLEYDLDSNRLEFVMEDGELRNFGIPVEKSLGMYLQNHHVICVALRSGTKVVSDMTLPLITHGH